MFYNYFWQSKQEFRPSLPTKLPNAPLSPSLFAAVVYLICCCLLRLFFNGTISSQLVLSFGVLNTPLSTKYIININCFSFQKALNSYIKRAQPTTVQIHILLLPLQIFVCTIITCIGTYFAAN